MTSRQKLAIVDVIERSWIASRAVRGPLDNLLPNLHRFCARLEVLRVREAAHEQLLVRTWPLESFDDESV